MVYSRGRTSAGDQPKERYPWKKKGGERACKGKKTVSLMKANHWKSKKFSERRGTDGRGETEFGRGKVSLGREKRLKKGFPGGRTRSKGEGVQERKKNQLQARVGAGKETVLINFMHRKGGGWGKHVYLKKIISFSEENSTGKSSKKKPHRRG